MSTWVNQVVATTYRAEWGRLLSLLVTRSRRLDLAEDALSEAFVRANEHWPERGVPANPAGWLHTTASRLIVGYLRSEAIHGRKVQTLAAGENWVQPPSTGVVDQLDDDRLTLILLCCHPALRPNARAALALRLVVGTSTEDIAQLFLVQRSTMAARITRAKKKIVASGIPLVAPADNELEARLEDVCRTIYLAFTAGYAPARGTTLLRTDLAGEAVELAAILHRLAPSASCGRALYGLMLLQHGRRDARETDGELITLPNQDRSLWHHDELRVGADLVVGLNASDRYTIELQLQGLIAREHAIAPTAVDTDWTHIAELYRDLEDLTGSPIVRLNRAVAVAECQGPQAGLALLASLDDKLPLNHRVLAVRADLARRSGDTELALRWYGEAIELCENDVERRFLVHQKASVGAGVT